MKKILSFAIVLMFVLFSSNVMAEELESESQIIWVNGDDEIKIPYEVIPHTMGDYTLVDYKTDEMMTDTGYRLEFYGSKYALIKTDGAFNEVVIFDVMAATRVGEKRFAVVFYDSELQKFLAVIYGVENYVIGKFRQDIFEAE